MPKAPGQLTISFLAGLDAEGPGLSPKEREEFAAKLREEAGALARLAPTDVDRLLGYIGTSLQRPLANVLEEVWKQRKELHDAAGRGGTDGDEDAARVSLVEHEMTWTTQPSVTVVWNGQRLPAVTFDVEVKLELEGVTLVIKKAHITQIETGTVMATISVSYRSFPLMAPRTKKVDLPGELTLPDGGLDLGPSASMREGILSRGAAL
jgi:hypothetical protein